MKNNNLLLKDLTIHLMNTCCFELDLNNDILNIEECCMVVIEDECVAISFEVITPPTLAGIITKEVIDFCKGHAVEIYEPYAYVCEKDVVMDMLFGEEAVVYYETGELPNKSTEKVDPEKIADTLLDQIGKKGMNSLSKEQKEFLNNFSKRKGK